MGASPGPRHIDGRMPANRTHIGQDAEPARRLPSLPIEQVFHVGTMNAADKGFQYRHSYEGHGLSVSVDPDEWERIARLGGLPHWSLVREGGRLLDAHALGRRWRRRIEDWGIEQGYVARIRALRVRWWDSEDECEYRSLHRDLAEARAEAAGEGSVRSVVTLAATPRFDQRISMSADLDCFDQLLGVYVEEQSDLDGVWWQDEYRELSAPRGVIVPSRLGRWTRRRLVPEDSKR